MPGNYIDDLAKSNLEHFQPEFDPNDWKAMDAMLESGKKSGMLYRSRKLLIAAAAILLFLTGGLLGYFIDKTTGPENILKPANQPNYSIEHIEKGTLENFKNDLENAENTTDVEAVAGSADNTESGNASKSGMENKSGENVKNNSLPPVNTVAANNTESRAQNKNLGASFDKLSASETITNIKEEQMLTFFDMTSENLPDMLPFKDLQNNLGMLPDVDHKQKLEGLKKKKSLSGSIGFLMSPDLNIPNNSSTGFTTGITGELAVSKKVSLATGILFSKKKYKDDSELQASATFIPEATAAEFQLIEVPLLARYNINTNKRLQPFISGGISGYFPVKEEYDIYCKTLIQDSGGYGSSGTPIVGFQETNSNLVANSYNNSVALSSDSKSYEMVSDVKNVNNYHLKPYLGFLNLSAGVEYRLSPAISFQLAPQVKLPLTGMGLEEKMVTTISLNSSIKYHFGN